MPDNYFEPPVFEIAQTNIAVDLSQTPFFYNDGGNPTYLANLPAGVTPLTPAASNPAMAMGCEHVVSEVISTTTSQYGNETQLGFVTQGEVTFEPMWATRTVAAAFGITLVEPGQGVKLDSPVSQLNQVEYEYGVFAGHWSPYQQSHSRLISRVITDLEHHDFPHVFASTDPTLPLVISVGRYWPELGKIRLADLWVPRGSALYIPPKPAPVVGQQCLDLHNNRNSARAAWGHLHQDSILTHTLLQQNGGFFYWYWNAKSTAHSNLPLEQQG